MSTQLSLFDSVIDRDQVSITDSVIDRQTQKMQAIQNYLKRAESDPIACVTKYSPGKRQTEYFRLSYRQKTKIKHIHIRGGSTTSQLATYRAGEVQALIDRGAELQEVIAMVKTFNS